jgi:uncharacterized protein with HEPN domain
MKKDPEIFLFHILDSINLINEYTYKLNESHFRKNHVLKMQLFVALK